jgi:hypothetical protein
MPGAEYHNANECRHQHYIRPVAYTFFTHGTPRLKEFVKENLEVDAWERGIDAYIAWLAHQPGNNAPNPIKLYWWILKFWGALPQWVS